MYTCIHADPNLFRRAKNTSERALSEPMEQLPRDLLDVVCAGLAGFELFQLSHTSARLLRVLSASQVWRRFFPQYAAVASDGGCADQDWKQRYMQSRSIQFEGRVKGSTALTTRVLLHHLPRVRRNWRSPFAFTQDFGPGRDGQRVTIDTWFALLSENGRVHGGGILFGAQSCYAGRTTGCQFHQQFIAVDSTRNLYCSLLGRGGSREPVMAGLSVNRWYHLAVAYDGPQRMERVFVDGTLVVARAGEWHRDWHHLTYSQVGTGCVPAGANEVPSDGRVAWHGFHGIVDDFRVWRRALEDEEIEAIADGTALPDDGDVWFAISRGDGLRYEVDKVVLAQCTRPRERQCLLRSPIS